LYNTQYGTVRASINNGCGASGYSGITVFPGSGCQSYSYSYFPNPGEDELTVEATNQSVEPSLQDNAPVKYSVVIFDAQQNIVREAISNSKRLTLDLRGIKKGIYFLRITDDQQVVTQRLIID
jgi:hypothetical protein